MAMVMQPPGASLSQLGFDNLNATAKFGGSGHLRQPDDVPYGPDGLRLKPPPKPEEKKVLAADDDQTLDMGWFHADSNRFEQQQLAQVHLNTISAAVDSRYMSGQCPDCRWINDPEEFPDLRLRGTFTSNGVLPFPPHDQQFYIRGIYDPLTSKLAETALPAHGSTEHESSVWARAVDFTNCSDSVHLFDETTGKGHFGRVIQGALDNGYFVEALQAISMRPKLARQLFYCWDSRRSIYIARIFKHGTWTRVELDDFLPVGNPSRSVGHRNDRVPICCRSEHFPHVLWPSLIEKAYAKVHTLRGKQGKILPEDRGGWEAISGGGRVEEALADLTGGIAGRFHTNNITADRLFVYLYEMQRDTLFVCRPNQLNCEVHGIRLNPYYANVVNRAVEWEGKLYVQVFCSAPGVFDGGLQDITVPYSLTVSEEYPERTSDGFFWMSAYDFHEYFGAIFECRLVNCGDVSLQNMPPLRIPPALPAWGMGSGMGPPGIQHLGPDGVPLPWFEWVWFNPGVVKVTNQPEFSIIVPETAVPCEIVASLEQLDTRMLMDTPMRQKQSAVLVKVYELINGQNYYSKDMVCRSNWLPIRDSVVSFVVKQGGTFKLAASFPDAKSRAERMIFRCYATSPMVTVTAAKATYTHLLIQNWAPPKAQRLSVVGNQQTSILNKPMALDEEHDTMRKPAFDLEYGFTALGKDFQEDCSIM